MISPFDIIKETLSESIPLNFLDILPNKWEQIGDVLVVKLDKNLDNYKDEIGKIYCDILKCKTVLNDIGGISGVYRKPNLELIYGSNDTVTIHKENGIRYKLDVRKIMFSSGNMDERIRMANISNGSETVVDLFSGIGYFTLPLAVYSVPKKIFACEINPVAYGFLCENIILNDVSKIVIPLLGNNKEVAPKNIADRVIMGYFDDNYDFLPVAFNCLKNFCGFIHYHRLCPEEKIPKFSFDEVKMVAENFNRKASLISYNKIKSYAPGISHVVLDVYIGG